MSRKINYNRKHTHTAE